MQLTEHFFHKTCLQNKLATPDVFKFPEEIHKKNTLLFWLLNEMKV